MTRLRRDMYRRKLEKYLSQCEDEPLIGLISAIVALQGGDSAPLNTVRDFPSQAIGAELGSPYHIPLWSIETLVNELLATPKARARETRPMRRLRTDRFNTLVLLHNTQIKLENAEDHLFLQSHDAFYTMSRIAQQQFAWQRGVRNAPTLYRSLLLYGSESAGEFFKKSTGISVADFVKVGMYLTSALGGRSWVDRRRDLTPIGITPEIREAALARFTIAHAEARVCANRMRLHRQQTAYRPSLLRNHPILAFGDNNVRLRAPIPELIAYRYTWGLYFDVVGGEGEVWKGIGHRFEIYVRDYLKVMMAPYDVAGESTYGSRKTQFRTPDVLISKAGKVVCAIECKAKRMSFQARFADDPVIEDARGFDEMAKGVLQLWRFFSHARSGRMSGLRVDEDCQAVIVTADSWLALAPVQAKQVFKKAHHLADRCGDIPAEDRRDIAFYSIDDVERALQYGTADGFLATCREVASGDKKEFMLSIAHASEQGIKRPYPFIDRLEELLPSPSPRRISQINDDAMHRDDGAGTAKPDL